MRISFITFVLACLSLQSLAQLTTAKLFADHMVLQRNQPVPVWGWSAKNAKVTINFNGQTVKVKADAEGNWKALLKPMPAGGPYVMKIFSGKNELIYEDVMLGEVWICSGQSNMEFQLKNAYGYKFEQQHAGQLPIRQFDVPKKIELRPEKDLSGGKWAKADSNTVGNFTAVGYFFAEKLARELHVTVGLINSNWGGTQVEDWISRDAMLASPELGAAAKTLPENLDDLKARVERQLKEYAYKKGPVVNYIAEQLAAQPATFFESWQKTNVPGAWEWTGKLYSYRGEGFTQHTIKLDNSNANHKSVVSLGPIDASLEIYINGRLIQHDDKPGNFQLELPTGTWKGGDNSLLIRLMAEKNDPSRYNLSWNGTGSDYFVRFADTTISLADGNWHTMPDLSKPYHFDFLPNNTAFALYNTMVNPLIPYGIAGVIWYQGESNADRAYQYRSSFPLMISDWRNKWHRELPFLFVQLASFGSMQGSDSGSDWAELREAQTIALQLPNTGMAVTTDVGDPNNIHPRDKADVGARLASKALSMVYQRPGFYESPLFSSADFSSGSAIVIFVHAERGLSVKDKYGYIKGFELAGADHKFYYAQAAITGDNKVKVWCSQVPHPESVRYGWTNAPVEANLFSKDGFPVSPFRSDNWKGITDDKKFE